jgi:hypothetical protein
MSKQWLLLIACVVISIVFVGCAHQIIAQTPGAPGFWKGLLHGIIAPVSFIASLFTDCRIYAFPNAGKWYDFGFMLGIGGFGGGLFGALRSKKHN